MKSTTLQEIDKIRREGFRPQVVGCILHNKKLLFVYKAEHKLWQLPQGGIDNKENIPEAIKREMQEELGKQFANNLEFSKIIGKAKLIFPKKLQGSRQLQTDFGKKVFMLGKKYFFIALQSSIENLNVNQTEFDDYKWVNYKEALKLTNNIHQSGKKMLTFEIITALYRENML